MTDLRGEVHIEGETEVTVHVLLTTKLCLGMKQQTCHMFVADFLSVESVDINDMEEVSMFLPQAV